MATKMFVHFDTNYRTSGTQTKPTFQLTPLGIGSGYKVNSFYVDTCTIPYSFYSFANGSQIEFSEDGGVSVVFSFFIPAGNYSAPALATLLADAMTSASGTGSTYVGSYSTVSGKMSFQQTVAGTATGFRIIGYSAVGFGGSVDLTKAIGFRNTVIASPQNALITGTDVVDLAINHHNLYVKCNAVQVGHSTSFFKNRKESVILKFPLTGNAGTIMQYQSTDMNQLDGIKNLNSIDFELVNEANQPVSLNGLDWSITLVFNTTEP
jgi:hypothetical protein